MSNSPDYAVTAIGRDRPGIVAAISAALLEVDGNLEDSHMSILRGHFAVMLIVRAPEGADPEALAARLGGVRDELGLEALTFEPVDELADPRAQPTHRAQRLRRRPARHRRRDDRRARRAGRQHHRPLDAPGRRGRTSPIYAMLVEIALGDAAAADVERSLEAAEGLGDIEVSLRELEAEAL